MRECTDRQTNTQTNRQTDSQTVRQLDRQADKEQANKQITVRHCNHGRVPHHLYLLLCHLCLCFLRHLCLFTSCETTISNNSLIVLAVHGCQQGFQGLGLLSLGFRSGFTPFQGFGQGVLPLGLGLFLEGHRPGLRPFRVSAFIQAYLSIFLVFRGRLGFRVSAWALFH